MSTSREYTLIQVQDEGRCPIVVTIEVEKRDIEMEVDTGAAVSLMSSSRYHSLYPDLPLQKSKLILTTYTGEQLKLVGEQQVEVNYGSQRKNLTLHVVEGSGPSLLGRDRLRVVKLDWCKIATLDDSRAKVDALLTRFSGVFQEGLSTMNTFKARLNMKPNVHPNSAKLGMSRLH